ncbi:MAG: DUF2240 family protein [Candidatus Micrarchaeota archaeon]|nr:DUF2240 family protein [Candidatus Micrarchaeota archaeon]
MEDVIKIISEKSGLSQEEVRKMINDKITELSNLISFDGAAYIVAKELGIELLEKSEHKLRIKNVLPGMRNVSLQAKVTGIYEREFERDGKKGRFVSIFLEDETGRIRLVLWNDQAEKAVHVRRGDTVSLEGAFSVENNGVPELRLSGKGSITVLSRADGYVRLSIMHRFEPKTFFLCPECGSSLKDKCENHPDLDPVERKMVTCILDDGTRCFRGVFFGHAADRVIEIPLAKEVMVLGQFRTNKFTGEEEFVGTDIREVDVKSEIKKLIDELSSRVDENNVFA